MTTQFDSPWKEALDRFLQLFLAFFYPNAHDDIDWSRGYESLDKELAQIVREAKSRKRLADKLFKVWRKNGEETWVLIHIEVQAHKEDEDEFTLRIFTYHYRIFDRYRRPVASFVVLADDDPDWKPGKFEYTIWNTRSLLEFSPVKLLDYRKKQRLLEKHENPFALVVLAHLQSLATRNDSEKRRIWKVRLVKNLLERGLSAEDIRQLFRVIDWFMDLPEELSKSFWDEIQEFEKEKEMPVFTSTEKYLIGKGRDEGRKEGRKEGEREAIRASIKRWLEQKFGEKSAEFNSAVQQISDIRKLQNLQEALWNAKSLTDVRTLLSSKTKKQS